MSIRFTVKNYRSFTDENPAKFEIDEGFVAFVGPNNGGKTALLRMFYEIRAVFRLLNSGNFPAGLMEDIAFDWGQNLADNTEPFTRFNDRPISIRIEVSQLNGLIAGKLPVLSTIELTIKPNNLFSLFLPEIQTKPGEWLGKNVRVTTQGDVRLLEVAGTPIASVGEVQRTLGEFHSSMFIPAFRNAINFGADDRYFDIQVGSAFIAQWDQYKAGTPIRARGAARRDVESVIQRIFRLNKVQHERIGRWQAATRGY